MNKQIVFVSTSSMKYVADRVPNASYSPTSKGFHENCVFMALAPFGMPQEGTMINSSPAMCNFVRDQALRKEIGVTLGLEEGKTYSTLYGFFNGQQWSDILEVQYVTRLMNKDIGPRVGMTWGVGYSAGKAPVEGGIPCWGKIQTFLQDIGYVGEVMLEVTEDYQVCQLYLGHNPSFFALFCEISKSSIPQVVEFLVQEKAELELFPAITLGVLVSKLPFPLQIVKTENHKILAPANAEKHLWRFQLGYVEPVLATTHGAYLAQARSRIFITVKNLVRQEDSLMYRTDIAQGCKLLFSPDVLNKEQERPESVVHTDDKV